MNLPDTFQPFAEGGFGTPDGKFRFQATTLDYLPPLESRLGDDSLRFRFPLELISPKNPDSMNSTFGNRPDVDAQTAVAFLHPLDAARRDIQTGDRVRLYNDRGACVLPAVVGPVVGPCVTEGVVSVPSSRWPSQAPDGRNTNVLTSERLTDIGGGPVFYSCLIEVEKSGD